MNDNHLLAWEGLAEVLSRSRIKEANSGKILVANCAVQGSSTITPKYQAKKKQESGIKN
ncbi:MAG: hypothetical protein GY862_27280 [Gammaproteobacteria bacterium]|nr:hypothetical protein [Gammaproteobacteria bacterium]